MGALVYGQITHHTPLPPPYNGLWTDHPPHPTPTTMWGHWSMDRSPTTPHSHHHIMVYGQITHHTPLPPPYGALVYGQITHHTPPTTIWDIGLLTDHPPHPTPTTIRGIGLWTDHPPHPTPTTMWGHWFMDRSPTTPHSHHHMGHWCMDRSPTTLHSHHHVRVLIGRDDLPRVLPDVLSYLRGPL